MRFVLVTVGLVGGLFATKNWLEYVGLQRLQGAMAAQGLDMVEGRAEFTLVDGFAVNEVVLRDVSAAGSSRLASLDRMEVDFDLLQMVLGRLELEQLSCRGATLHLPSQRGTVYLRDVAARIVFADQRAEILSISGLYHGVPVRLRGALQWNSARAVGDPKAAKNDELARTLSESVAQQAQVLANLERVLVGLEVDADASEVVLELQPGESGADFHLGGQLRLRDGVIGQGLRFDALDVRVDWDREVLEFTQGKLVRGQEELGFSLHRDRLGCWHVLAAGEADLFAMAASLGFEHELEIDLGERARVELEGRWQRRSSRWLDDLHATLSLDAPCARLAMLPRTRLRAELVWDGGEFWVRRASGAAEQLDWEMEVCWRDQQLELDVQAIGAAEPLIAVFEGLELIGMEHALVLRSLDCDFEVHAGLLGSSLESKDWQLRGEVKPYFEEAEMQAMPWLQVLETWTVEGDFLAPSWQLN